MYLGFTGFFEDLMTNQSMLSTIHSLSQAAVIFSQLANMTNIPGQIHQVLMIQKICFWKFS